MRCRASFWHHQADDGGRKIRDQKPQRNQSRDGPLRPRLQHIARHQHQGRSRLKQKRGPGYRSLSFPHSLSGPGYSVPVRHHLLGLIRPSRRHIAFSPHGGLYAMPSLCGSAEATREWFRAFTAHSFLACRPLRPRGVRHRYPELRCRHWPSPNDHRLGTPDTPAIRSTRAVDFVASLVRFRYSLPGCSPPFTDQTGTSSPRGLLLPGFQRIGLPPRCWI